MSHCAAAALAALHLSQPNRRQRCIGNVWLFEVQANYAGNGIIIVEIMKIMSSCHYLVEKVFEMIPYCRCNDIV